MSDYIMLMSTLIDKRQNSSLDPSLMGAGRLTALASQSRGRGAKLNISGRFEALSRSLFDDGWAGLEDLPPFRTQVF